MASFYIPLSGLSSDSTAIEYNRQQHGQHEHHRI